MPGTRVACRAYATVIVIGSLSFPSSACPILGSPENSKTNVPTGYRCYTVYPASHRPGPAGPKLDKLRDLNAISFELDARWYCEDIAIWSIGPYQGSA